MKGVLQSLREPLVLGLDLDLTLIDTRAATAHALRAVNRILNENIDVDAFVARLGPPIRDELLRWIPRDRVDAAVTTFRASFTNSGLDHLIANPGAVDLLASCAKRSWRSVLITSRRPKVAAAALEATGLHPDVVVGGVTGEEKAPAMREHGVSVYIGDHPLDMLGAAAAGVPAIGVLTGFHGEQELRAAGAALVVPTLEDLMVRLLSR